MVRDTLQIGDPKLKACNTQITDFNNAFLQQLIQDMQDTMRKANLIGIAAPQIGENYTIFVTEPRETKARGADQADEFRVFINPKIVHKSTEECVIYEGCGSVLHGQLFGPVSRPKEITIEAFDSMGDKFRFTADGILGRVIQHEYDHLIGVEFLEKVDDYRKMMTLEHYIDQIKPDPVNIKNSIITIKEFEKL